MFHVTIPSNTFLEYITGGIVMGLIAGISPGPLLTLVISETLKNGNRAGIRMAMVPMISDLPIVLFSLFLLSELKDYESVIGVISLAGSLFLVYLALENLLARPATRTGDKKKNRGFIKGVISNFLSPHPYLFWILVGGSMILSAAKTSIFLAGLFVVLFYLCLIGSKIVVAILTHRFSNILQTKGYLITIRILGVFLLGFAVYFFIQGVNYII